MDFNWSAILGNTLKAAIGETAIVYALAAIGLNLHFGYTGLLNFGQAAFLLCGAYGLGIVVLTLSLPLWLGIPFGIALAVLLALLLGIPTLRLRADYLAIATIAAAEFVRLIVKATDLRGVTGGSQGLNGFADSFAALNPFDEGVRLGPAFFRSAELWTLTIGWSLVALLILLTYLLAHSPWGRVVRSIREDEDAARSLGKNVYAYKMQALVLGGVIGAFAGMMFALSTDAVQPDNYGTALTFFVYTVLILGGAARVFGPAIGAIIFWGLLVFIEGPLRQGLLPASIIDPSTDIGAVRNIIVGIGLMLLIIYRPQGIFGDREELRLDAR